MFQQHDKNSPQPTPEKSLTKDGEFQEAKTPVSKTFQPNLNENRIVKRTPSRNSLQKINTKLKVGGAMVRIFIFFFFNEMRFCRHKKNIFK